MIFLKRTVPLMVTFCVGFLVILAFFAGTKLPGLKALESDIQKWAQVVITFTMVLGAVSLLRINLIKISRKVDGWGYNLVLVVGFVTMSLLGFLTGSWPMFESVSSYTVGQKYDMVGEGVETKVVTVTKIATDEGGSLRITVKEDDTIGESGGAPIPGKEQEVMPSQIKGFLGSWLYSIQQFLFHGVFKPAQSTMFSLLAFFVASASFRAFRVKSKEAILLMGTAFIVMLGNVPIGNMISHLFASIGMGFVDIAGMKEWIMIYPNSAGQSAILIGAVLGYISASMKVLFGVERSYLGGEQ
jgi:hypothetical protein